MAARAIARDEAEADALAFLKAVATSDADAVRVIAANTDRTWLYLHLARLTLLALKLAPYEDPLEFLDEAFAELQEHRL